MDTQTGATTLKMVDGSSKHKSGGPKDRKRIVCMLYLEIKSECCCVVFVPTR